MSSAETHEGGDETHDVSHSEIEANTMQTLFKSIALTAFLATALFAVSAHAAIVTEILGNSSKQCVDCAREKVPSLPKGLYSLADKKKIINSRSCKKGSVAIVDVGNSVGHVAFVSGCDDAGSSQSVTLDYECNYIAGRITRRTSKVSGDIKNAEKELRIIGYFRP